MGDLIAFFVGDGAIVGVEWMNAGSPIAMKAAGITVVDALEQVYHHIGIFKAGMSFRDYAD
ncbi:hypothetical protein ACEWPL_013240 [Roseovarius sp. S1116L3]|uniref:hypothetical protein n=1 Tax=Roseovarius roseus TaxID=3342636 RepID=UPI0037268DA5